LIFYRGIINICGDWWIQSVSLNTIQMSTNRIIKQRPCVCMH